VGDCDREGLGVLLGVHDFVGDGDCVSDRGGLMLLVQREVLTSVGVAGVVRE
jgi:hypothetical protein